MERLLIRAGAIATAIAALITLVTLVARQLDGDDTPVSATIHSIDVGDLVGIQEAFGRSAKARTCPDLPPDKRLTVSAPARVTRRLERAAQIPVRPTPTATPSPTATATATTTPTPTPSPRPTMTVRGMPQVVYRPVPQATELREGTRFVYEVTPELVQGEAQVLRKSAQPIELVPPGTTGEMRRTFFRQAAVVETAPGVVEPVGRLVDIDLSLRGLSERCVQVRFSLFEVGTGTRVKEPWLRDRPGLSLVPAGDEEHGSGQVWVPLPRRGGRFFVRMALFDDRGRRLTLKRSAPFRQPRGENIEAFS